MKVIAFIAMFFATVVWLLQPAKGDTINAFSFSFENANVGDLVAPASQTATGVSATWFTPNTGIENLGSPLGNAGLIRQFSSTNYQRVTFTTTAAMDITGLSFFYQGNTNAYPTSPSYTVSAVLDGVSLGTFTNSESNVPFQVTMNGPGVVSAGSHEIRWIAPTFTEGLNSGTDYMALNDIVLTAEEAPAPPSSVPEFGGSPVGAIIAALGALSAMRRK
jgi:hypothetical protein